MGQKEEQKEQRYMQILMIALDEFIAKGYQGTSTRQIAKLAGISSGLMFHYFDSKLALYETLLNIGCSEMNSWSSSEETPSLDYLEQTVAEVLDNLEKKPLFCKMFVFMDQASRNSELSVQLAERRAADCVVEKTDSVIEKTSVIIEKAQVEGTAKQGSPIALASALWCSIQGIAQSKTTNPKMELPEPQWMMDIIRRR